VGGLAAWACLPDVALNLCGNGTIDPPETCDPGVPPDSNPGCVNCQIVCQSGAGGAVFVDPLSNHCYFTAKKPVDNGAVVCGERTQQAHVVTFVNDEEAADVVNQLKSAWPVNAPYWVGLNISADGGVFSSQAVNEPGYLADECTGCFVHGLASTAAIPFADAGADVGPGVNVVAVDSQKNDGIMEVAGTTTTAQVICEREPVGSRSVPCFNGYYCFTIAATLTANHGGPKRYAYSPGSLSAANAEAACASLGDAGAGTAHLVVFASRPEREQVIYELYELQNAVSGTQFLNAFWIGMSARASATDAGPHAKPIWVWDDGVEASTTSTGSRPAVWGNHEPRVSTPSSYAYILISDLYDTGLAHPETGAGQAFPYACEY